MIRHHAQMPMSLSWQERFSRHAVERRRRVRLLQATAVFCSVALLIGFAAHAVVDAWQTEAVVRPTVEPSPAFPRAGRADSSSAEFPVSRPAQLDALPTGVQSSLLRDIHTPEGRLIEAVRMLGDGRPTEALAMMASLVRDHPDFALAQLTYADMLNARAGRPVAFGDKGSESSESLERLLALREEAGKRWSAQQVRPATGLVPVEFVHLPPTIRHAVAVDAAKSRLYLFENGPGGLRLVRDLYVSVGKRGVGKTAEGDKRTPLGVYWISEGVTAPMRDERLGKAALRINYPNAWDRLHGRTGGGVYLHGAPPQIYAHTTEATDGCVSMADEDALMLLGTVEVGATPVLISRELNWVSPTATRQRFASFRSAFDAWNSARERSDREALSRWYEDAAAIPAETLGDTEVREDASLIAWQGDQWPVVVATSWPRALIDGPAVVYRQYWALRGDQWRIVSDVSAPLRANRSTAGIETPLRQSLRAPTVPRSQG